jgi:segregation and condensation protein B
LVGLVAESRTPVFSINMPRERSPKPQTKNEAAQSPATQPRAVEQSPLSLNRLRAAFAQMLGAGEQAAPNNEPGEKARGNRSNPSPPPPAPAVDPCEINPRTVVESMLFVGRPTGEPFSARELAAAMRGVSPAEIETAVAELNAAYERDAAPYEIIGSAQGYHMQLRSELNRMRDKLHCRNREAKLTPAAVEVLSIVAYNQPTTVEEISDLRGTPSGPAMQSLVRRRLVRVDRPADRGEAPQYSTTDRFLRLFGLENIAALPRNEELEKL